MDKLEIVLVADGNYGPPIVWDKIYAHYVKIKKFPEETSSLLFSLVAGSIEEKKEEYYYYGSRPKDIWHDIISDIDLDGNRTDREMIAAIKKWGNLSYPLMVVSVPLNVQWEIKRIFRHPSKEFIEEYIVEVHRSWSGWGERKSDEYKGRKRKNKKKIERAIKKYKKVNPQIASSPISSPLSPSPRLSLPSFSTLNRSVHPSRPLPPPLSCPTRPPPSPFPPPSSSSIFSPFFSSFSPPSLPTSLSFSSRPSRDASFKTHRPSSSQFLFSRSSLSPRSPSPSPSPSPNPSPSPCSLPPPLLSPLTPSSSSRPTRPLPLPPSSPPPPSLPFSPPSPPSPSLPFSPFSPMPS